MKSSGNSSDSDNNQSKSVSPIRKRRGGMIKKEEFWRRSDGRKDKGRVSSEKNLKKQNSRLRNFPQVIKKIITNEEKSNLKHINSVKRTTNDSESFDEKENVVQQHKRGSSDVVKRRYIKKSNSDVSTEKINIKFDRSSSSKNRDASPMAVRSRDSTPKNHRYSKKDSRKQLDFDSDKDIKPRKSKKFIEIGEVDPSLKKNKSKKQNDNESDKETKSKKADLISAKPNEVDTEKESKPKKFDVIIMKQNENNTEKETKQKKIDIDNTAESKSNVCVSSYYGITISTKFTPEPYISLTDLFESFSNKSKSTASDIMTGNLPMWIKKDVNWFFKDNKYWIKWEILVYIAYAHLDDQNGEILRKVIYKKTKPRKRTKEGTKINGYHKKKVDETNSSKKQKNEDKEDSEEKKDENEVVKENENDNVEDSGEQLRIEIAKTLERPELLTDLYEMGERIGSGGYAVVHKGVCRKTGEIVAIKIISSKRKNKKDVQKLQNEIENMKILTHDNIVSLIDVFYEDTNIYMILEYVNGGELFDEIVRREVYSEQDAAFVIRQILEAIEYMHSNGIAHRDLKPENLLCTGPNNLTIKVADFGLSKEFEPGMISKVGTPDYLAPELLSRPTYNNSVDIWSVGVLAYILLCGSPPFFGENNAEMFKKIMNCDWRFFSPEWDEISLEAKNFVSKILVVDPDARPSATECLRSTWIASKAKQMGQFSPNHRKSVMLAIADYSKKKKK